MILSSPRALVWGGVLAISGWCSGALAAIPAESFLPASTVGFVALTNPAEFEIKFKRTGFGKLADDASLKPFADQIRTQLTKKLGNLEERLGVTPEALRGITSGEMAFALIPATPTVAAFTTMSVDTSGNAATRDALLDKIVTHLNGKGGKRTAKTVAGIELVTFTLPATEKRGERTATWFVREEQLVVTSSAAGAEFVLAALTQQAAPLNKAAAFAYCMEKVKAEAASANADVTWFIDPFAFRDAVRSIAEAEGEEVGDDDVNVILRDQGFDAIKAAGGQVHVAVDAQHDFVHRSAVYAPKDAKALANEKYRLAMRMLVFPNRQGMQVERWIPRESASYVTVNFDLLNAYDNAASLFDAIAGYEGAFKKVIDRFEKDPFGPKIKFRQQIIESLGTRVSMLTDYTLPITPQCERFLTVIEVKPDKVAILREAIGKYVGNDGYIKKVIDGHEVWEFQPAEEPDVEEGLLPGIEQPEDSVKEERILVRSAVCVTDAHLLIASDVELLRKAFAQQAAPTEILVDAFDFQDVMASLDQFGSKERSSWGFFRIDERARPGYELLRQGKMPESETFAGRLMNDLLTSDEEDENRILRRQKIDGSKLPSFEVTRRYLGPAGQTVRTDEDGWLVSGVVLAK